MRRWPSFTMLLLVLLARPYATNATQHTPEDDGNALLRKCTVALRALATQQGDANAWFAAGWCLGYVLGFGDGHRIGTDPTMQADRKDTFTYCGVGTRRMTVEQRVRMLVQWLRTHPKILDLPQSYVIAWAFANAFPCPSTGAQPPPQPPSNVSQPSAPKAWQGK
jgi:hypothetical protein